MADACGNYVVIGIEQKFFWEYIANGGLPSGNFRDLLPTRGASCSTRSFSFTKPVSVNGNLVATTMIEYVAGGYFDFQPLTLADGPYFPISAQRLDVAYAYRTAGHTIAAHVHHDFDAVEENMCACNADAIVRGLSSNTPARLKYRITGEPDLLQVWSRLECFVGSSISRSQSCPPQYVPARDPALLSSGAIDGGGIEGDLFAVPVPFNLAGTGGTLVVHPRMYLLMKAGDGTFLGESNITWRILKDTNANGTIDVGEDQMANGSAQVMGAVNGTWIDSPENEIDISAWPSAAYILEMRLHGRVSAESESTTCLQYAYAQGQAMLEGRVDLRLE